MIEAILGEAITVGWSRHAGGSYSPDGQWVKGVKTSSDILAAVQPAQGRALQDLEEGIRDKAEYFLWSQQSLATDDVITYGGNDYRVLKTWPRPQDNFVRAVMGQIENAGL